MAESMRGMRLGSQSLESDRGVALSERQTIDFRCSAGHEFSMVFSLTAELPDTWECKKCDEIATRLESGKEVDLAASELSSQRSHYDMVLERRSKKELEVLLQEVLVDMRKRRSEGRLTA